MAKKLLSLLLSFALVWTSGGMLDAALEAPDLLAVPSNLPQFRLQPPWQIGRIADYFNASVPGLKSQVSGHDLRPGTRDQRLVILIQDLHAHYGVQKNIAALLEFLSERLPYKSPAAGAMPFALAVEGASGPIDS